MNIIKNYTFTSERLGFRNWIDTDIIKMAKINSNPNVMAFFPCTQSYEMTREFIERMQQQFSKNNYCYFAVDQLSDGAFIGFIGLSGKDFESDFTPCIDIGWRLDENYWSRGFATEGAKACLDYGFNQLKLERIIAIAPVINIKSEDVMKKIGMKKIKNFNHPLLPNDKRLQECMLYEITNSR